MSKIDLPDGGWAELRAPEKVPERLRRPVVRAQTRMAGNSAVMDAVNNASPEAANDPKESSEIMAALGDFMPVMDELNDLIVVALVSEWSLAAPVSMESLLDCDADVYDALRKACAPHMGAMMPDFSVDGVEDKDSPTEPSSA